MNKQGRKLGGKSKRYTNICASCGSGYIVSTSKSVLCNKCRSKKNEPNKRKARQHRFSQWKLSLILKRGGCCALCGYNDLSCLQVFDFHHLNPQEKESNIPSATSIHSREQEAEKCLIVCSNCHRKIHSSQKK